MDPRHIRADGFASGGSADAHILTAQMTPLNADLSEAFGSMHHRCIWPVWMKMVAQTPALAVLALIAVHFFVAQVG